MRRAHRGCDAFIAGLFDRLRKPRNGQRNGFLFVGAQDDPSSVKGHIPVLDLFEAEHFHRDAKVHAPRSRPFEHGYAVRLEQHGQVLREHPCKSRL